MNKKVNIISFDKKKELFKDALLFAYRFWCDKLCLFQSSARVNTDKSFIEILDLCLSAKYAHWTILYRKKIFDDDFEHWEFGVSGNNGKIGADEYFIWICVRPEPAEQLIEKYGLEVTDF